MMAASSARPIKLPPCAIAERGWRADQLIVAAIERRVLFLVPIFIEHVMAHDKANGAIRRRLSCARITNGGDPAVMPGPGIDPAIDSAP